MRQSGSICVLLLMEISRNIMKRMQLRIFGLQTVTKNRMDMATLVEWIVEKARIFLNAHLIP